MRAIEFRGKRYSNGQWVYGDLCRHKDGTCTICGKADDFGYEVNPETVGQFTGLHDKNGKEIYEGDIIRTYGNNFTYEVIYNEKSAAFIGKLNSRVFGLLDLYESDTVCRGIIGNIHDNPELLKRGKKRTLYGVQIHKIMSN